MASEVDVMMPDVMGARITKLMNEYKLTKTDVAKYCDVTEQVVWYWMRGERIPSDANKIKLSKLLHRTVKFIFFTP